MKELITSDIKTDTESLKQTDRIWCKQFANSFYYAAGK